jgi:hypothetical protein
VGSSQGVGGFGANGALASTISGGNNGYGSASTPVNGPTLVSGGGGLSWTSSVGNSGGTTSKGGATSTGGTTSKGGATSTGGTTNSNSVFSQCRFHFGTIDSVAKTGGTTLINQLDFFTPGWMGTNGDTFDQAYVCEEYK